MQQQINFKLRNGQANSIIIDATKLDENLFRVVLTDEWISFETGKLEETVLAHMNSVFMRCWADNPEYWIALDN